jgi:hypothetical protein
MILANTGDDAPMIDLSAEIRRQFAAAHAKWGDTFDLRLLESSWGDTMDDEEMLAAVIQFQSSGKYLDAFMASANRAMPAIAAR